MSQAANVSNGEASGKKKRKPKHAPEGFLRSVELKKLVYFVFLPALTVAAAVFVFLVVSSVEKERAADQVADLQMHADFSKAPLPLTKEVTILTHDIDDIEWSDTEGFIDSIIMRSRPVRVRNSPVHSWAINEWDLTEVARKGLMLNGSRLQSSPVFVLGHERDKGGMIGSESDLEVSYVNAYLKDFLNAVFDKDTYLYWTGPCSIFETFLSSMNDGSGIAKAASIGPWEALRVAESSINISLEDSSLWTPMLWLSHPGVTAHTHYDTQHNFFAHIMGRKKMLIFELASELYPYPNVHRSYRQSQVRLEEASTTAPAKHRNVGRKTIAERFPRSKRLNAYELTVTPGDLLYIPPFWAHRVESETLALSVSVLSPSSTEVSDVVLPILRFELISLVPFGRLLWRKLTGFVCRLVHLSRGMRCSRAVP